jgi:hypothetical protein
VWTGWRQGKKKKTLASAAPKKETLIGIIGGDQIALARQKDKTERGGDIMAEQVSSRNGVGHCGGDRLRWVVKKENKARKRKQKRPSDGVMPGVIG